MNHNLKIGLFVSYAPNADLRGEGLGRLLLELTRGMLQTPGIQLVICCPKWSLPTIEQLFDDADLAQDSISFLTPKSSPAIVKLYQFLRDIRKSKSRKTSSHSLLSIALSFSKFLVNQINTALVSIRSIPLLTLSLLCLFPFAVAFTLFAVLLIAPLVIFKQIEGGTRKFKTKFLKSKLAHRIHFYASKIISTDSLFFKPGNLFRLIEERESSTLATLANKLDDVSTWYSPSGFLPEFNNIRNARVMCIPDVVLNDFPAAFAGSFGDFFSYVHARIEASIRGGDCFVVYSQYVKWHTLVARYNVAPEKVFVVPHGANRLDYLLPDPTSQRGVSALRARFASAVGKAMQCPASNIIKNGQPRFIFFASQIRPHKNVLALLKAYAHLLRVRYIPQKLILTGNPYAMPEIWSYVQSNNLRNDVLFLHGLSSQELAACYALADLAISPSLSEGGCPFTLTEALSVDTPVVLARIAVTEEVVTDPAIQDVTLFDPYDWRDMADKIHWALGHREEMLAIQKPLFNKLSERSWATVAADYLDVFRRAAINNSPAGEGDSAQG